MGSVEKPRIELSTQGNWAETTLLTYGADSGTEIAVVQIAGLIARRIVTFAGEGVTAAIQPGATDTRVMLRVTVTKDAAPGARTVTVTAPGGTATGGKLVFAVE